MKLNSNVSGEALSWHLTLVFEILLRTRGWRVRVAAVVQVVAIPMTPRSRHGGRASYLLAGSPQRCRRGPAAEPTCDKPRGLCPDPPAPECLSPGARWSTHLSRFGSSQPATQHQVRESDHTASTPASVLRRKSTHGLFWKLASIQVLLLLLTPYSN